MSSSENQQKADQVFAAMLGMPELPNIYVLFKANAGWSRGGGWPKFKPNWTPKVWVVAGQLRGHLTSCAQLLGHEAGELDLGGNDKAVRQRRVAYIPNDWYVVNLIDHGVTQAREFYLQKPKRKRKK